MAKSSSVQAASILQRESIPLSALKPNPGNPRYIDKKAFEKLKTSLKRDPEFMPLRPLVLDHDLTILGGNQRYRALKDLGYTEVPKTWVKDGSQLTPEQKRRFVLVDNGPKGMTGDWDFEILANEWDPGELQLIGFAQKDFDLGEAPQVFPDIDETTLETSKTCPKCGYKWS